MKPWFAALLVLAALPARADDLRPLCPDRPGKGTSPCTVDAGHAQVELGLYDASFQKQNGATQAMQTAGAGLLKYGLTDSADIEAGLALYQNQRATGTPGQGGIGDLYLRAKWMLPGGGRLAAAIEPFLKLPTAAPGLGNGAAEGGLVLPLSYDLGEGWSLGSTPELDLLLNGAGGGHHAAFVDVVGLGRALGPVTLGAEIWTAQNFDPAGTGSQYSFDLDAAWQPGANMQLDCGVNAGLNSQTPRIEVYAGISERF